MNRSTGVKKDFSSGIHFFVFLEGFLVGLDLETSAFSPYASLMNLQTLSNLVSRLKTEHFVPDDEAVEDDVGGCEKPDVDVGEGEQEV